MTDALGFFQSLEVLQISYAERKGDETSTEPFRVLPLEDLGTSTGRFSDRKSIRQGFSDELRRLEWIMERVYQKKIPIIEVVCAGSKDKVSLWSLPDGKGCDDKR